MPDPLTITTVCFRDFRNNLIYDLKLTTGSNDKTFTVKLQHEYARRKLPKIYQKIIQKQVFLEQIAARKYQKCSVRGRPTNKNVCLSCILNGYGIENIAKI